MSLFVSPTKEPDSYNGRIFYGLFKEIIFPKESKDLVHGEFFEKTKEFLEKFQKLKNENETLKVSLKFLKF